MPFLFGESRLRFCCHSFIQHSNSFNAIAAIGHRQLEGLHAPLEVDAAIDILATFLYTRFDYDTDTTHKYRQCAISLTQMKYVDGKSATHIKT